MAKKQPSKANALFRRKATARTKESLAEENLAIRTTVNKIVDDSTRVRALGILYEAERLALSGIHTSILTTVVALLTYIGVLGGFLSTAETFSSLVIPYLPLPAWALGIFFVAQLGQLQAHVKSIKIIERDVVTAAGLAGQDRYVGTGSERSWNRLSSPTAATYVFYATFFVSLTIITAVTFAKVIAFYGTWPLGLTLSAVLYSILLLSTTRSVLKLLRAVAYPELDDPDD